MMARFIFYEGKLDEFKRLSSQCTDIVRAKDRDTLQYEICASGDESECIVLERYWDFEALIEHMTNPGGPGGDPLRREGLRRAPGRAERTTAGWSGGRPGPSLHAYRAMQTP